MRTGTAWVAALVIAALATVEMPHVGADHHDSDFGFLVAHDSSAHYFGSGDAARDRGADHCVACHLGRSFKPGLETTTVTAPVVEARSSRRPEESTAPTRAPVAQPPLRSPPHVTGLS